MIRRLFRLLHVHGVLLRYGIDELFWEMIPGGRFLPLRFFNVFFYLGPYRRCSRGERLYLAMQALGPIFVKLGQLLSTRSDILPDDVVTWLSRLQDHVAPFSEVEVKTILRRAYPGEGEKVFAAIEWQPLAAASIAQVHAVTLQDGREAVIKILRPNIASLIRDDVALLKTLVRGVERVWPAGQRLKPLAVVEELERSLLDELDLVREASNASLLRRQFLHKGQLHVPEIFWAYSNADVLCMERLRGIPIAQHARLRDAGIDFKKLAENLVEVFFAQLLDHCFFHADMHPGNVFVSPKHPFDPTLMVVDFGIMGSLSATDQRYLVENFLAFFKRDYRRVAALHVASGWVPKNTRVEVFEAAIRTVCEPVLERPLRDISCAQLMLRLLQTARRFDMEVQPQLLLLQKSLLHMESLARSLCPELDLWAKARPQLERWVREQWSVRALIRHVRERIPYWLERLE